MERGVEEETNTNVVEFIAANEEQNTSDGYVKQNMITNLQSNLHNFAKDQIRGNEAKLFKKLFKLADHKTKMLQKQDQLTDNVTKLFKKVSELQQMMDALTEVISCNTHTQKLKKNKILLNKNEVMVNLNHPIEVQNNP